MLDVYNLLLQDRSHYFLLFRMSFSSIRKKNVARVGCVHFELCFV